MCGENIFGTLMMRFLKSSSCDFTEVAIKKYLLCRIFGHRWRYWPGTRRYITCRWCGRLPDSQWETFKEIKNG